MRSSRRQQAVETHSSPVPFLPHSTASPPLAETTAHSVRRSAPTQCLHVLQNMCVRIWCAEAKPRPLSPNRPHPSLTVNLLAHGYNIKSSISTTVTSIECLPRPKQKAPSHPLAPWNLYQDQITEISVLAPQLT